MSNWMLLLLLLMAAFIGYVIGTFVGYRKVLSDMQDIFEKVNRMVNGASKN